MPRHRFESPDPPQIEFGRWWSSFGQQVLGGVEQCSGQHHYALARDAFMAGLDPDLRALQERWPALDERTKAAIFKLATAQIDEAKLRSVLAKGLLEFVESLPAEARDG
jgi:hypothetical protein